MPSTDCLCVALFAPGSVDAEVGRLQASIFAEHGIASAHAVPPLVPIGFVRDLAAAREGPLSEPREARTFLAAVERSVGAPWRAVVASQRWHEGFLFLSVESGALWAQAREALRARIAEPGFFPAVEGFFLGCGDATDAQRASIRCELPRLSFSSATIALVRFSSPFDAAGYWREVRWETLAEQPLRGRRAT